MNLIGTVLVVVVGSWVAIPGGAWSPAPKQLTEIRSNLEPFVKQQALKQNKKLPIWSSYTFQYQGQVVDKQEVVLINAFCIETPEYSKHQFVLVFDGGPCFFQVKYDPNKKKFFQLMFNGEA